MILTSLALAAVTFEDPVPCSGKTHLAGTTFDLRVHTEIVVDGTIARQRTADETWKLDDAPWPDALQKLSKGCQRVLTVPAENAATAGLTEAYPGAQVRMVLDVREVTVLERKAPDAAREVPTVIRHASGLGTFDFEVGLGKVPRVGQEATVEYTLWLEDGSLLDSSWNRDEPFSYAVGRGQVIPGWEEGVQGMRVGGVRQMHVPWKLGYGRRGSPPRIPEKADLIFEVHLLSVK